MQKDAYHHGDLRQALLDASLELIEEKGLSGLSLRAAARAAGVSASAPYHHFPNRSAILAAIAEQGFHLLHQEMDLAAEAAAGDPVERMRRCGLAYVRFARKHPGHFRLMFRPELADREEYPALEAAGKPVFGALVEMVEDAQAAGVIPSGDPIRFAIVLWSTVQGLSNLITDGPLCDGDFDRVPYDADALEQMVSQTLAMVMVGAAAAQRAGVMPPLPGAFDRARPE
jgi:AcrR family transcriptional regulator